MTILRISLLLLIAVWDASVLAAAPTSSKAKRAVQESDPILLRKHVVFSAKEGTPPPHDLDCTLRASQLQSFPQVASLISKALEAPLGVKYIFVPIEPRQAYYAYQKGQEQLLESRGDSIQFREPEDKKQLQNASVRQLQEIVDKLCGR